MESLHYLLMKSHTLLHRRIASGAAELGLTPGQPKVLDFLSRYGESDQKTIADYCEIEPSTVGSILLRMEKSGLVMRRQREGNRRSLYVSLTEKGRKAAEEMQNVFAGAEAEAAAGLSAEEAEELKRMLLNLCGALSSAGDPESARISKEESENE